MKKMLKKVVFMAAVMMVPFVNAGSIDDFSSCLVEKTSGEDRLDLIKWMYVGMSGHPTLNSMNSMNSVTSSEKETTNQKMGALFDRLLAKDCATEFKGVYQEHGQAGMQGAFSVLGEVAMAELMQSPEVSNDLMLFTNYIDVNAFEKMLQE